MSAVAAPAADAGPYPGEDESWEEFAEHQLTHDPTPAQARISAAQAKAVAALAE